jgi:hypothetical protein
MSETFKAFIQHCRANRLEEAEDALAEFVREVVKTKKAKAGGYTPDFEAWWKHHPRKIEKPNAFKEWRKLSTDERAMALDYIEAYAEAWDTYDPDKVRRSFCPYPERWLKRHRWQDDPQNWILEARGK